MITILFTSVCTGVWNIYKSALNVMHLQYLTLALMEDRNMYRIHGHI